MVDHEEIDLSKIVNPERSIVVFVNFRSQFFDQIFSKLEVLNASEYLFDAAKKLEIPLLYIDTIDSTNYLEDDELSKYNRIKEERRRSRTAPKSILDADLNEDFKKYAEKAENRIKCRHRDLFDCDEFVSAVKGTGRTTIMFAGFFTELEITRTAAACIDHGLYGVTISDATSTFSERIYYQALDIISQATEVIDTRDLMKLWP